MFKKKGQVKLESPLNKSGQVKRVSPLNKSGQITVFIILGLLLFLSVSILIFIQSELFNLKKEIPQEIITHKFSLDPIKVYFEDCLNDIAKEATYSVSFYGGYLYPSGIEKYDEPGSGDEWYNYYYYNEIELPFLLDGDTLKLRPKEEIQKMISNFVLVEAQTCIDGLEIFEKQGFTFDYLELPSEASTTIRNDEVFVKLHFPFSVTRDQKVTSFEDFSSVVELRLGLIYNITKKILDDIKDTKGSEMLNLADKCSQYIEDDLINIYLQSNAYTYEYVLRVVDALPLSKGDNTLKFQFALKNVDIQGECDGPTGKKSKLFTEVVTDI